jgi:oxaloacetate decarboxylase gamma subunit
MTIADMLEQSGVLTLLGMGIVFGFLFVLILSVTAMGKIIHALGLDKQPQASTAAVQTATVSSGGVPGPVVAAISAAVKDYRETHV